MKKIVTVVNKSAIELLGHTIQWCMRHPDVARLFHESFEKSKQMPNIADKANEGIRMGNLAIMEYPEAHEDLNEIINKYVVVNVEVEDGQT